MKSSILYRIAAVLLLLFAIGHQTGFRNVDPAWQADALVRAMQSTPLMVQGFSRTYWGFFSGFGFFTTAFLVFSAVLAWELGRGRAVQLSSTLVPWAFAVCYILIAIMTWAYFFLAPGIFATLIAVCLILAAIKVNRERVI